jgi:hypothetical protein
MEANGSGRPFWITFIISRKLAFTPGPYTTGGRMIVIAISYSAAIFRSFC